MSDAADERSKGGSGATWAACLVSALLLYPLSPAPAIKLIELIYGKRPPANVVGTFQVIYEPLFRSLEHSTSAQRFYEWYFKLWGI